MVVPHKSRASVALHHRGPDRSRARIADRVGVTERAAHRILNDLVVAGYVSRQRIGRRNRYTVGHDLPLPDRLTRTQPLGELLAILSPSADQDR